MEYIKTLFSFIWNDLFLMRFSLWGYSLSFGQILLYLALCGFILTCIIYICKGGD